MRNIIDKVYGFLEPDKALHIIVSLLIIVSVFTFTDSLFIATIATVLIGLFKEFVLDKALGMGVYNMKDMYANLIGTVIGMLVCGMMIIHTNIH